MADKTVDIELKTSGDSSGAQQVQRDLEKIEKAQLKVAEATKAEAEAEARLTKTIEAKVDAIAKEAEARAEAKTAAGRGNGPSGEAGADDGARQLATLGKLAVAVGVVAGGYRLLRNAAQEGADAGDAGAKRTLEGMDALSNAFKSLLDSLAGSKAGQAVGDFAEQVGKVIGPSKEARDQLEKMNAQLEATADKAQAAEARVAAFSREVREATAATAADNALNAKVASEEEARLQLFKRRRLAGIDPAASEQDQAKEKAKIEIETLAESQKIKEELARRDIENADRLAQKKREEATELDRIGKNKEAEAAREEARKLDTQAAARAAARQRERLTETDTVSTVTDEQARAVEVERLKAEEAAQKAADKKAKEDERDFKNQAKEDLKEEKKRFEKFGLSPDAPDMRGAIAGTNTLATDAAKGIPFGDRDPSILALRQATAALQDGGTEKELAALGAALDKFAGTLKGLRFREVLDRLEKQIDELQSREAAERK